MKGDNMTVYTEDELRILLLIRNSIDPAAALVMALDIIQHLFNAEQICDT